MIATACIESLPTVDDSPTGEWILSSINNQTLPRVVAGFGGSAEFVSAEYRIAADGSFRTTMVIRQIVAGSALAAVTDSGAGTWEQDAAVLTFTDTGGLTGYVMSYDGATMMRTYPLGHQFRYSRR